MKLPSPFSIYDLRFTIGKKPSSPVVNCHPAANRQSAIGNRQSKKGIALVITLILLSVTLIMALALLALSNRERNSVTTTTDTAHAKLAADSALAAAQAEIIANIFATNNGAFNFSLLVSTNYINETNDYYFYTNGNPYGNLLTGSDFIEAATNQMNFPRAPVFLTNALTGNTDFRFYLDLNRNGVFDQNFFGQGFDETNAAPYLHVGDPEWIGVLARPDAPHSANNQFIARYAFFAQPIGNGLDLNAIHNEAYTGIVNSSPADNESDGFLRNQGVGSWEINLAAFLADLNTNQWDAPTTENPSINNPYNYQQWLPSHFPNTGSAFEDARALLSYRYGFGYTNQAPLGALSANASFLQSDYPADLFPYGPLMTNTSLPLLGYSVNTNNPWAGSNNTNQFFDLMTELYDTSKVSGNATTGFTNHLINASTGMGSSNPSTYDRYTFYRMLSQLGTDSEPDEGKMNLNYSNVLVQYDSLSGTVTNITVIPGAETNLVSWTPTNFFIAAANRMLLNYSANWFANSPSNYLLTYYGVTVNTNNDYYNNANGNTVYYDPSGFGLTNLGFSISSGFNTPLRQTNQIPSFGVTNIPVYVNGQFVYSPAVNRVLQLAANLYDASTNSYFPSVFRPVFERDDLRNIFIVGYVPVNGINNTNDTTLNYPYDITGLTNYVTSFTPMKDSSGNYLNVFNVPWIIGAKKGFPNFNNFTEQNQMSVIRRLQVTRLAGSSGLVTNQMYMMNLQSTLGADFWNSYASNFNDGVSVVLQGSVQMGLTNNDGVNFSGNEATVLSSPYYTSGGLTYAGNGGISELGNGALGYNYGFSTSGTLWPGSPSPFYSPSSPYSGSFITWSNVVSVLPYSVYRTSVANSAYTGNFGAPSLIPTNWFNSAALPYIQLVYETNGPASLPGYQLPQFGLLTTNRLQTYIIDTSVTPNRIIDYVQLSQMNYFNVNANIFTNNADTGSVWNTNYGVANQILISAGLKNTDPADAQLWNTTDATTSQNNFQAFIYGSANTNQMQAGYTPFCAAINYIVWAANDPLVHYTAGDLTPSGLALSGRVVGTTPNLNTLPALGIGGLNPNYYPWGRTNIQYPVFATSQQQFISTNSLSFWLKDPLAFGSINWDFPTNKYPSVGWIGRVHRGTPWQTVYLKSTDVLNDFGLNDVAYNNQEINNGQLLWLDWSGDQNLYDSGNSAPAFDRQLFDLFTTALNDNATRGTLSVNVGAGGSPSLSAWSAVLSGVVVLTNIAVSPQLTGVSNSWLTIQPAGIAGTNSALWQIVNNINATRADTNWFPLATFSHVGDVLRAPLLTQQSPFLNWNNSLQQSYGISDEVYEQIPQQIMGLLRVSSTPRYVIYGYGQTLRPANKGLVLDSSAFGLVTNYQVVAESAVRAVVSVQTNIVVTPTGFQTNYSAKVESYNVLPPN